MTDIAYSYDEEEHFFLPTTDTLGVLSSTHPVVEQGEHVWINKEQVEALSDQWVQSLQEGHVSTAQPPLWDARYHFHDGTERTVNWLLVLDAVNFCFWAEKGQPRWRIEYQGETLNGYWAEAAALKRAVDENIPVWDAEYLSTITDEVVAHIFRGSPEQPGIPLFEERVHNMREVGQVLLAKYDGQFSNAVESVHGSAVQLALLLAHNFPSFYDVETYRNQEVRFFKRAQICVADLHGSFDGKQWGAFHDLDRLTIFADYKLPQVLRHYTILEYHPALAERVDNQELLEQGSEEEIEIRAATIWACELLRRTMHAHGYSINAAEIDQRLWLAGQSAEDMRPYHRTRTMFY